MGTSSASAEYDYAPKCPDCGERMRPSFTEFFCPREESHLLPVDDGWEDYWGNKPTSPGTNPNGGEQCIGCGSWNTAPFIHPPTRAMHCWDCGKVW